MIRAFRRRRGSSSSRSRSTNTSRLTVPRLSVLVISGGAVRGADTGLFGGVAIAHVVRSGVGREDIWVFGHARVALTAETTKKTALLVAPGAVAGRVVVSWSGAEAFLLAAVADEGDLDEGGEGKENAGL